MLCPVCKSGLVFENKSYKVAELFELWRPVEFSADIIRNHLLQGENTCMAHCMKCELDIFLPSVIGTPEFYSELQQNTKADYYVDNKWDFDEALKEVQGCNLILEIGCGPGKFLCRARQLGAKVIGTEMNPSARSIASSQGLDVFEPNLVPYPYGTIDTVFSFHVLEHVKDPLAFIQEMVNWVRPGGRICISVPNQDGPIQYIDPCVMNMPPHHATRWRYKTFVAIAERYNLKIDRVAYEPLLLQNHNYYSYYWINWYFEKHCFPERFKRFAAILMVKFFEWAKKFGDYFPFLKGQAIYIVLSKPGKE